MNIPVYVIIVAGGSGVRMGSPLPKQFMDLAGQPVLGHTIQAFANALPDARIILVLPAAQMSNADNVLLHLSKGTNIELVNGGATRFDSVKAGLERITSESIILVHDGVRPLVSSETILACIKCAMQNGSAIPVIPATDSMRMFVDDGEMSLPIDRSRVRIVQTPQGFHSSVLVPAFDTPFREQFTDEATVVEYSGRQVSFFTGDKRNIKITTSEDLVIAEALLTHPAPLQSAKAQ